MATQKKVFENYETVFSQTQRNPEAIAQSLVSMCDELKDATGGGGSGSVTAADVAYNNTVSGLSATNVQNAVDEVVVGKADKTDLTSISQTGSTATQNINAGQYFYLDGSLKRAKTVINNGATFSNANCENGQSALNRKNVQLYFGVTNDQTITLSDDAELYDFLVIQTSSSAGTGRASVLVPSALYNEVTQYYDGTGSIQVSVSGKTLSLHDGDRYIRLINGMKI